jgi:hypothetical protein
MTDDWYDEPSATTGTVPAPGPVFTAAYDSECSEGDEILTGDSIRADGEGGYVHASCLRLKGKPVIWE